MPDCSDRLSPALKTARKRSSRGSQSFLVARNFKRLRPPSQLIQHVLGADLQVGKVLELFALLPYGHEVGALDVDGGTGCRQLQFGGNKP